MDLNIGYKLECNRLCRRKCDPERVATQIGGVSIANLLDNHLNSEEVSRVASGQVEVTCTTGPDDNKQCAAGVRVSLLDAQEAEITVAYMLRKLPPPDMLGALS